MITKETYEDLCSILEAIHGVAWDTKLDVEYYNALVLITHRYEKEKLGIDITVTKNFGK